MIKNVSITLGDTVRKTEGHITSNMGGEKVMLSIKNGKYYNVGDIGGVIWDLLDDTTSVSELVANLIVDYNVSQIECEEHVVSFLNILLDEELIEIKNS
ncbi:lasso peptide biosynthesis PqqD family chaperone [Bacillus sp. ISL-18]|uniref:lasso peptide biosynthesis PqqD family chaperone n=1 Tax=Bacillus sp. ISL-18 TaxID=2819118 RepID=UPI001BEAC57D|nr:lasso peptide biosynthesis PqqD family chaperone [Bacillus sp. ISL-18]MBT2657072.1 lasso peptide biosynthesis PqqD family chaperone [Bacillus sp. ISL-18]